MVRILNDISDRVRHPTLRNRLVSGRVVPIISDEALVDLALPGGYGPLVEGYARYISYSRPDRGNLDKMAQFHKMRRGLTDRDLKFDYLSYVKDYIYREAEVAGTDADLLAEAEAQVDDVTVSQFAHLLGYPRLDAGIDDPLLILANLPFSTVLTTSPYTFIEEALLRAGKQPRTEVCRWRRDLDSIASAIDDAYIPSELQPLVFHLLGVDQYPDSLVLTEDDFLEYLGNINQGRGDLRNDPVPALVRRAFYDYLLVLGFDTDGWPFRVIYNGLIKPIPSIGGERGVFVAVSPPEEDERRFLENYLGRGRSGGGP